MPTLLTPLASRTYRHLFAAQVIALLGTGLATVALGLVAYRLAGAQAGAVLGTALAIKMVAYVTIAPIATAFAAQLPRRAMLVTLDLVRAAVALCLPFVDAAWQIYALIFLMQAASAAFTPTFQATIPDILPDEAQYTRALSLSQLAYNLENLGSPTLAAALLTVISPNWLFAGTSIGFLASAALVVSVALPSPKPAAARGILDRTTHGMRLYLATPRLRGLLAFNLAVAAAGAMVIVNTVVLVQGALGLGQPEAAWALAAFGAGSMTAALALPSLLDSVPDRSVMLAGAGVLVAGLLAGLAGPGFMALLPLWFVLGLGYSAVLTRGGACSAAPPTPPTARPCSPPSSPSATPAGWSHTPWPAGSARPPASPPASPSSPPWPPPRPCSPPASGPRTIPRSCPTFTPACRPMTPTWPAPSPPRPATATPTPT